MTKRTQQELDQAIEKYLNPVLAGEDIEPDDGRSFVDWTFLKCHTDIAAKKPYWFPHQFFGVVNNLNSLLYLDDQMIYRIVERLMTGETIHIESWQFKLRSKPARPKSDLYQFAEILGFAETECGVNWNEAHRLLDYSSDFCILAAGGRGTREIEMWEIEERLAETPDHKGVLIVKKFMEANGINYLRVTR